MSNLNALHDAVETLSNVMDDLTNELGRRPKKGYVRPSGADLAETQRRLVLLVRDASQLSCTLYSAIRLAQTEEIVEEIT